VLVVSGDDEARRSLRSAPGEHLDFLAKPLKPSDFAEAIRRLMLEVGQLQDARILHVEDDPALRSELAQIVAGFAFVDSASRLQDAREKLRRERYDLLVLDLVLPDGDGMELVNDPPAGLPPILVYSRHALSPDRSLHIAAALLKRDTTPEKLEQVIRMLVRRPECSQESNP
jgi:DNA-binding response OmpR family regulator